MKWLYELYDNEIWNDVSEFDTREDCLKKAIDHVKVLEADGETIKNIKIGQKEKVQRCGVDGVFILENVAEDTVIDVGEVGEDYLANVKNEHVSELEDALNNVLFEWMDKHDYNPSFFRVVNIEEFKMIKVFKLKYSGSSYVDVDFKNIHHELIGELEMDGDLNKAEIKKAKYLTAEKVKGGKVIVGDYELTFEIMPECEYKKLTEFNGF